jgi:hypothetical protein
VAEAHYPERCGRIVVANAPPWFFLVWRVVRPLVSPATREKVAIARPGPETYAAIADFADDAAIPAAYGGALADPCASSLEAELRAYVDAPPAIL